MAARHLLLDLAGVLCRFDSTARLERLAAVSGLGAPEVDERLYGSGIVDRCDRGELDAAGIRGVLRNQLGLGCDDLAAPADTLFVDDSESNIDGFSALRPYFTAARQ